MSSELSFNKFVSKVPHITTISQVQDFAHYLVYELGVNFHPDTPFEDYITLTTHKPSFSTSEARIGNRLMEECFNVCESNNKDVYEETGKVWAGFMKE